MEKADKALEDFFAMSEPQIPTVVYFTSIFVCLQSNEAHYVKGVILHDSFPQQTSKDIKQLAIQTN